jgi:hypothetical protein
MTTGLIVMVDSIKGALPVLKKPKLPHTQMAMNTANTGTYDLIFLSFSINKINKENNTVKKNIDVLVRYKRNKNIPVR